MTRDETIDEVIREANDHTGDCTRDRLDTLTAYIAEQREEIRLLTEYKAEALVAFQIMETVNAKQKAEIAQLKEELSKRTNLEGLAPCWNSEHMKEITRLREVLKRIESYGGENGCCPYGCDTPHIAKQALTQEPT